MDRSHMKNTFTNSYGKILNMFSTEVMNCKVREYVYLFLFYIYNIIIIFIKIIIFRICLKVNK